MDAVLERPDDDDLRLRIAAELEGAGDPRGEFIRLQVTRWRRERAEGQTRDLPSHRENQLLGQHRAEWAAPFVGKVRPSRFDPGYMFHRGFVARIALSPAAFLQHGDALFAAAPIQHADIDSGEARDVPAVLASPLLARLRTVGLDRNGIDDALAMEVAACEGLRAARYLDLSWNHIGEVGVEALLASEIMDGKLRIELAGNLCDPTAKPLYDWDGSLQGTEASTDAHAAIARHGQKSWLEYPWSGRYPPSRFHM